MKNGNEERSIARRGVIVAQEEGKRDLNYGTDRETVDSDSETNLWTKERGCETWRKDKKLHAWAQRVSESAFFNGFVMLAIFANSIMMMLDVNNYAPSFQPYYSTVDIGFLSVYVIEFVVKVYAEPIDYWAHWSNRFDFFILLISFMQVFVDQFFQDAADDAAWTGALPILRTLRATRALRAMRAVSFVRGLQVLLTALIDTMKKSFINVMLILLFIMFLFAIFGYYIFGYAGGDEANWGDLGSAFLTLFSFVTVDGWFDAQIQMDKRTTPTSRIYTILFIIVGHFLIFNIFVGVNIMNIQEANESYHEQVIAEKEATLARKKETILHRQYEDVRKLKQKQIEKDCGNFFDMVRSFQESLRHDDYVIQDDLVTNLDWIELYLETLTHLDNPVLKMQQFHFELANIMTCSLNKEIAKRLGE